MPSPAYSDEAQDDHEYGDGPIQNRQPAAAYGGNWIWLDQKDCNHQSG
ncbi:hypothetical protein HNQ99_000032 [Rhizorhapis suberifaciens]|uniref:Uncharacterized protein n=2 Tax=Rhizorhapis suberifaciens TaxID=13656 RepID=A0A840HNZ5_9SPHN|nr:hypothetical protein [Rhizorhapis suberifaciens]